ncbi:MAG: hypothetical protein RL385_5494 [Pseudomonadota bacterium]
MTHVVSGKMEARRAAQKRLLRRLGMGVSLLSVALVVVVFALIVRTERAHDETACPFAAGEKRALEDVVVREETRSCLSDVEERRYIVIRGDKLHYELGRKRLPKSVFAAYRWSLRKDAKGLVLDLHVHDKLVSEFHDEDLARR